MLTLVCRRQFSQTVFELGGDSELNLSIDTSLLKHRVVDQRLFEDGLINFHCWQFQLIKFSPNRIRMQASLFKNKINQQNRNNNNIPSNLFLRNCFIYGQLIFSLSIEYFSSINWIVLLKFFGNICFTLLTRSTLFS